MLQRVVIDCSPWYLIVVFRLSWEGYETKKKYGTTKASYTLLSITPYSGFQAISRRLWNQKKNKVPQRDVIHCSLWHLIVVFRLSQERYETIKNKVPQRAVIHCSLSHLIMVFVLVREGYETKNIKVPQRVVIHCSLWHLIVVLRLSQERYETKKN